MKRVITILFLCALLPPVTKAQTMPCAEAMSQYMSRYPESEPTDLYKLVFQDIYGPGHLLTDSNACAIYLLKEMADMEDPEIMPLYEYTLCDSNFVRVNLIAVRDGKISLQQFVSAIMRSAKGIPQPDKRFVMSHSQRFKDVYDPHYRIVRRDIFERELLPLLGSGKREQ